MAVRDWVINATSWQDISVTGGLYNPLGQLDSSGELTVVPLTFNRGETTTSQDLGVPELAHSQTPTMTLGYVHWNLAPADQGNLASIYEANWRATLSMRITRWPQSTNGQTIGDIPGYDLTNVPAGNDHFVWHYERHIVNQAQSDWAGTSGSKASLAGSVRVNVRYTRRIEQTECMVLIVQFLQGNQPGTQPWEDVSGVVFLDWQSHVRTFVNAG